MAIEKTVVITGAAMGIGAVMARTLADHDWTVFAGVLPGVDRSQLGEHPNIIVTEQDVSDDASVAQSVTEVGEMLGERPLGLLVNNAAIADVGIGVIEGLDIEAAHRTFEVNIWGQVRVCQAFLPMIRKGAPHSRIINFASGAVKANPAASGAYTMSKHAVTGLTNTLRNELAPFGIEATALEVGAVRTAMTADAETRTKHVWTAVPDDVRDAYAPHLTYATTEKLTELIGKASEPQAIVDEILALLDKPKWRPWYLVGKDVKPVGPLWKLLSARGFEKMLQKAVGIPQFKG